MPPRTPSTDRSEHTHGNAALLLTGVMALAFVGSPADARGPSCGDRSGTLSQACSDSNLEASIGALRVAYDVAETAFARQPERMRELHYTQKLWLTQMHGCGANTICLATSIVERQRRINLMRLGPSQVAPMPLPDPVRVPTEDPPQPDPEPAPRTWWPTPPVGYDDGARGATVAQPLPQTMIAGTRNVADGRHVVVSDMSSHQTSSAWLAALVLLVSTPFGFHLATRRAPARRCPSCDGTRIAWERVGTGRHLPARRADDVGHGARSEIGRMRLSCPCGYRSDAAMDAHVQYELDFHRPTTLTTRINR